MNSVLLQNLFRFILLAVVQITMLNHVGLFGFLNPYLYVLFILLLPFEAPRWVLLVSAFALGITIDAFSNTMGLHAAATTLMAFSRPGILRILTSRKEYEPGIKPGVRDLGIKWFASYASILILFHHFVLFYLDAFRLSEFFPTLLRVIFNSLLTLMLVLLTEYLFNRAKK